MLREKCMITTGEPIGVTWLWTGIFDNPAAGKTGVHPDVPLSDRLFCELCVELLWWAMKVLVSAVLLGTALLFFLVDVTISRSR